VTLLPAGDDGPCLFSIVTVCRNAKPSIAQTVESVLAQSAFAGTVEHVVIDGASTDGTLDVLRSYPHLRVLSEPDAGVYDAMNKGVSRARGEYVGILNADDWYEPDALASVAEAFLAHPETSIVHGDIRRWNYSGPLNVVKPASTGPTGSLWAMPLHHPASFARRELFNHFGPFDTTYRIFGDFEWVSRVIRGGALLYYCPRVLTNFRVGGLSTMRCSPAERYRVFRAAGANPIRALAAVSYGCAAVLRNQVNAKRTFRG
jgi:glycosyltransferase involved in cell wall biosynthesis